MTQAVPAGPRIPDVTIEEEIGRGGMGVVYRGRQQYLDRVVAVKILSQAGMDRRRDAAERFRREAKILATLKHPNVVACHQAGVTDDGACYLVMELIRGPSLHSLVVSEGALAEGDALEVAREVALALDHALAHGIIHRDVKPENVLLERRAPADPSRGRFPYIAKVADLGLARPSIAGGASAIGIDGEVQLTTEGIVIGTPANMAPEQFDDPGNVDFRADIYALGCTLYFALTGQRAFSGAVSEVISRKAMGPAPDPRRARRELRDDVAELVRRLTAPKRDDRPQSYAEVVGRLERLIAGSRTGAVVTPVAPIVAATGARTGTEGEPETPSPEPSPRGGEGEEVAVRDWAGSGTGTASSVAPTAAVPVPTSPLKSPPPGARARSSLPAQAPEPGPPSAPAPVRGGGLLRGWRAAFVGSLVASLGAIAVVSLVWNPWAADERGDGDLAAAARPGREAEKVEGTDGGGSRAAESDRTGAVLRETGGPPAVSPPLAASESIAAKPPLPPPAAAPLPSAPPPVWPSYGEAEPLFDKGHADRVRGWERVSGSWGADEEGPGAVGVGKARLFRPLGEGSWRVEGVVDPLRAPEAGVRVECADGTALALAIRSVGTRDVPTWLATSDRFGPDGTREGAAVEGARAESVKPDASEGGVVATITYLASAATEPGATFSGWVRFEADGRTLGDVRVQATPTGVSLYVEKAEARFTGLRVRRAR